MRIVRCSLVAQRYRAAVLVGADWYSRMTGEPVRPEGGAS